MPDGTIDGDILGVRARIPKHVVYRDFATETVVLNLETGQYHGLNPTGGRILAALERSAVLREAANELAEEYGRPAADVERDVEAFCGELLARGLIELEQSSG